MSGSSDERSVFVPGRRLRHRTGDARSSREARVHDDRGGLFVKTREPDRFFLLLNEVVAEGEVNVESVAPVDDDLSAVYQYLIGSDGGHS